MPLRGDCVRLADTAAVESVARSATPFHPPQEVVERDLGQPLRVSGVAGAGQEPEPLTVEYAGGRMP